MLCHFTQTTKSKLGVQGIERVSLHSQNIGSQNLGKKQGGVSPSKCARGGYAQFKEKEAFEFLTDERSFA